jgi:integrase
MEVMLRDPVAAVEAPKCEAPGMRTLDVAGVATLLKAANGTDFRDPIAVLIGTGLRRAELLGLRWPDVDFVSGRLTERRSIEIVGRDRREKPPKTRHSARTLALPAFVIEALQRRKATQLERLTTMLQDELQAHRQQENGYVFDRADGSTWNPDSFSWAFADFVRRAKLPKVRLHDLRHSHATLALSAGTDLKMISAALGHSTIDVTANTHVHAIRSMQRSHADRIDAMLGETVATAISDTPKSVVCNSGPQQAHALPLTMTKARKYEPKEIAPAGVELAPKGNVQRNV